MVTVVVKSFFQMDRALCRHTPDMSVPLTTPEESQDREPQCHVAEEGFSHKVHLRLCLFHYYYLKEKERVKSDLLSGLLRLELFKVLL